LERDGSDRRRGAVLDRECELVAVTLPIKLLIALCERYVPTSSRNPDSLRQARPHSWTWWPAHELGHLLTVPPSNIGVPGAIASNEVMGVDAEAATMNDRVAVPARTTPVLGLG
jgi:hypothetical protein